LEDVRSTYWYSKRSWISFSSGGRHACPDPLTRYLLASRMGTYPLWVKQEAAKLELERYAVTLGVGAVFFSPEQLKLIGEVTGPGGRVEMNSFMQLIIYTLAVDTIEGQKRLREAGLGVYPVGPVVKNLHTCTFCMGERIDGLPDAQVLDQVVAGTPVPFPVRIGFSGCASNCGEALVRDVGIVRMGETGYDLYVGGKPGGLQPQFAQRIAEAVPAAKLPGAVRAILAQYRGAAKGKERLWKNVNRLGVQAYKIAVQQAVQGEQNETFS
jgi:precorrin-3B C17-methyltransferase